MKFRKTILRIFAVIFIYMGLCYLYLYNLTVTDLLSITGQISDRKIVFVQGTKPQYKHYPMVIDLDNFNQEFRLMDIYSKTFNNIEKQINIGDTVKIYYRTKLQAFIGFGKRFDIYQLEKDGQVLFPFDATKSQNKFSFEMMFFLAAFFYGLSFLIRTKNAS
ncbi:MAG: hypothetical protein EKK37_10420 [Sphingobacteriales bacterium]|nr:MAG: hypothetical protein EKK37_10420 [Sphingobacteriales bacterium]